tara:strand:+ start:1554 stop:1772 length:219 start_codon:yes stop_codon:yes gene_type:complete
MLNRHKKKRNGVTPEYHRGIVTLSMFKELFLNEHGFLFNREKHNPKQLERLMGQLETMGYDTSKLRKEFSLS